MNPTLKKLTSGLILGLILIALVLPAAAQQTQTARSANKGAGWGALAGLVFGRSLWDVAEGAMVGAAGGAAYGALKGNEQQKQIQSDSSARHCSPTWTNWSYQTPACCPI